MGRLMGRKHGTLINWIIAIISNRFLNLNYENTLKKNFNIFLF